MDYHIPYCKIPREKLSIIISKQRNGIYLRPNNALYKDLCSEINSLTKDKDFIWDWGCGKGMSTELLAKYHPQKLVIGVDQSLHRLETNKIFSSSKIINQQDNIVLVRADIVDIIFHWHGKKASAQHWLHPNPWQKTKNSRKRWPLHPIFPKAINMAENSIMRTNWLSYAQQWRLACSQSANNPIITIYNGNAMSAFEKKYIKTGTKVYQVSC